MRFSQFPRLTGLMQHHLFLPLLGLLALIVGALFVDASLLFGAPVVFGSLTEGQYTGEFLASEANGTLSREEVTVTVPASTTLQPGHVLAILAATGKYVPYDNDGTDGTEEAKGVLYTKLVNDTVAPVDKVATIIARYAEVRSDDLQWNAGLSANDKAAGRADLLTLGIQSR